MRKDRNPLFFRATSDFVGTPEESTLSFDNGDYLIVYEKQEGWFLAMHKGLTGWVPSTHLEEIEKEEVVEDKTKPKSGFRPPVPQKSSSLNTISRNPSPLKIPQVMSNLNLRAPAAIPVHGISSLNKLSSSEIDIIEDSVGPPPLPSRAPTFFQPPSKIPPIPLRVDRGEV